MILITALAYKIFQKGINEYLGIIFLTPQLFHIHNLSNQSPEQLLH